MGIGMPGDRPKRISIELQLFLKACLDGVANCFAVHGVNAAVSEPPDGVPSRSGLLIELPSRGDRPLAAGDQSDHDEKAVFYRLDVEELMRPPAPIVLGPPPGRTPAVAPWCGSDRLLQGAARRLSVHFERTFASSHRRGSRPAASRWHTAFDRAHMCQHCLLARHSRHSGRPHRHRLRCRCDGGCSDGPPVVLCPIEQRGTAPVGAVWGGDFHADGLLRAAECICNIHPILCRVSSAGRETTYPKRSCAEQHQACAKRRTSRL
jgi:hypothetical protein